MLYIMLNCRFRDFQNLGNHETDVHALSITNTYTGMVEPFRGGRGVVEGVKIIFKNQDFRRFAM